MDVAIGLPNTVPGTRGDQLVEFARRGEDPPKLLLGGTVDASFKRAARYGKGWILGGGTPDQARDGQAEARGGMA
jgi:alkanesulfonate monooxygenase SsuD/methylene tetrahydromethanopterin reductase-like flavin-dependent oxidoreductase (luciferase family)